MPITEVKDSAGKVDKVDIKPGERDDSFFRKRDEEMMKFVKEFNKGLKEPPKKDKKMEKKDEK